MHTRPPLIATSRQDLYGLLRTELAALGQKADLNHIDVSRVTDFSDLSCFNNFEGDISRWDVSNATTMRAMFRRSNFSGDVSAWDVSNVVDMAHMFYDSAFNGDLSKWNVLNVKTMTSMFDQNKAFKGDISKWCVLNVEDFSSMFAKSKFQGDISKWKTWSAKTMFRMFEDSDFNGDVSRWNVGSVENFDRMFEGTHRFNSDLSRWNVANANNFNCMFACSAFVGSIANWAIADGAKLTDMFENRELHRRREVGLYHWWVAQEHPEYLSARQREHFHRHAPALMGLGLSQVATARVLLDTWRNPSKTQALPDASLPLPELF